MEINLTNLGEIKALLEKHGLWAKKILGQNFLINPGVLDKIIEAAEIKETDHILEVGPGLGVLTKELGKKAKKVTSIELDIKLLKVLEETLKNNTNIEVIHADALRSEPPKTPYKVVANIPYYITSPLISHYLENENPPTSMTLLMQKEVAQKICLKSGKFTYLTLKTQLFANPTLKFKVSPGSFHPAPKVESAVLHLEYSPKCSKEKAHKIIEVAGRAFKSARKKLSNTIPELKDKLEKLELTGKRPQHLEISDWIKLVS